MIALRLRRSDEFPAGSGAMSFMEVSLSNSSEISRVKPGFL